MIYPAQPIDRQALRQLDIKCYDYPIEWDTWAEILGHSEGAMGTYSCKVWKTNGSIVGYMVYDEVVFEDDVDGNIVQDLYVSRLGVARSVRRRGFGSRLVVELRRLTHARGWNEFQITLPEYFLDGEENRGLDAFTKSNGLRILRTVPKCYPHYGRSYDGLTFRSGANSL